MLFSSCTSYLLTRFCHFLECVFVCLLNDPPSLPLPSAKLPLCAFSVLVERGTEQRFLICYSAIIPLAESGVRWGGGGGVLLCHVYAFNVKGLRRRLAGLAAVLCICSQMAVSNRFYVPSSISVLLRNYPSIMIRYRPMCIVYLSILY